MKNKKNVELLYPMLYFSLLALAACLLLSTPAESIAGLGRILTSPSQLTKDYFKLGGFGGTFLNVALMGLAYTAIHAFSGTTLNGMSLIAFFLPLGFGFFGLNILNIWRASSARGSSSRPPARSSPAWPTSPSSPARSARSSASCSSAIR